jgi:S1-C subfamily serine protease
VKYTEYDVSRDRTAAQEMVQATGQMGVPVIIVDGEVVIGFDRERLKALVSAGNGRRPRFGLKIADAASILRNSGQPAFSGAYIGGVASGSPGEKAGLKSGDIITRINSQDVSDAADAQSVLSGLREGNIVSLVFRRAGETRKSEIII